MRPCVPPTICLSPKVVLEGIVVREEQSRTADSGQRQDVFVVGTTDALGSKCLSL